MSLLKSCWSLHFCIHFRFRLLRPSLLFVPSYDWPYQDWKWFSSERELYVVKVVTVVDCLCNWRLIWLWTYSTKYGLKSQMFTSFGPWRSLAYWLECLVPQYGVSYIGNVATRKKPTGDNCCHSSHLDIFAQMSKMVIDSYQDFYVSTTQTIGISSGYVS